MSFIRDDMAVMLILPMTLMIIDWSLRGILCLYSKYEISSMRVIGNRYVRCVVSESVQGEFVLFTVVV